ncbi:hypothetical protein EYC84_005292 [Monilinia fructicola]|uniref:LCCL domain-containing protein n=1 Tax=Monilinia fructicola TaxID=38448 RepID=A0A5M9K0R1_MONFR|nr:hypothetical protein EYC84_005292 [Monilinia fructicola]
MGDQNGHDNGRQHFMDNDHPDDPIEDPILTHLLPMNEISDDESLPTPRFLQDQSSYSYRYLRWVPAPVRRISKQAVRWAHGPDPPRINVIRPWFPGIQEAPLRLLDQYIPKRRHRISLLVAYYFCWILTFALVLHQSTLATEIEEWGIPGNIGCGNTYWVAGNRCGLNGNDCRPFNGGGFAFRCPANCASAKVLNPRAVGAQEVNYRPLVIGGPTDDDATAVYRSDSFICGAAIHAGVIDNIKGGCGVVNLVGERHSYQSSNKHGIKSIGFDSTFPSSFSFQEGITCKAKDSRWSLLFVSLTFTILLSVFTTSPVSNILGKFLPAAFCAFVIYKHMGVERALTGLTAQIEKTILWLGGCWVGTLGNYTFEWIPIQRLNAHDINQQPGAKLALALIIIFLIVIIVKQIFFFRMEGRLIPFLGLYGIFLAAILISLLLPGLSLRIHHYILALLLLPGTSMQTRPALLYQGLLVGLFINGIARWGFDPVLQTPAALQGDAKHNSALPKILSPEISIGSDISTISFSWLPPPEPFDGISVLVNDVERFRGYMDEETHTFGYMQGSRSWDYTKAGIWHADGMWTEMKKGPSKVKSRSMNGEVFTF